MGKRIASQSKQTVRGRPKPAKVGLHRRLSAGEVALTVNIPPVARKLPKFNIVKMLISPPLS